MYRQHCSPNPYAQGPVSSPRGNTPFTGFKPRGGPRFQSSPRYQQQFQNSGSSPGGHQQTGRSPKYQKQSPRNQHDHSGYRSPYQSPPHMSFESTGSVQSSFCDNRSHNRSHSSSFSNERSFKHQNQWGDRNKKQMFSPRNDSDSNPGGCHDIRQYYNPTMLHDPWANLQPVTVPAACSSPSNPSS